MINAKISTYNPRRLTSLALEALVKNNSKCIQQVTRLYFTTDNSHIQKELIHNIIQTQVKEILDKITHLDNRIEQRTITSRDTITTRQTLVDETNAYFLFYKDVVSKYPELSRFWMLLRYLRRSSTL